VKCIDLLNNLVIVYMVALGHGLIVERATGMLLGRGASGSTGSLIINAGSCGG
jgi:hypothetical protein